MANRITWAMPYRPALARLRRSTAYGVLGLAAIAIAGCSDPSGEAIEAGGDESHVRYWTDPETGCEYLIFERKVFNAGMGGITARLDSAGKPICGEGE